MDIGSRKAVDVAPHRLAKDGTIRHIARGVYDFPKEHLRTWSALSISRGSGQGACRARPHTAATAGAYAANVLGLSEQVPAKAVFLTDGTSRTVKIGPTTIQHVGSRDAGRKDSSAANGKEPDLSGA